MQTQNIELRTELIATVRSFGPRVRAMRDEIEEQRRLPEPLAEALQGAGLLCLLTPRALGGLEVDPATWLCVLEEAAALDGSLGWLLLANMGGLCAAYLDEAAARPILAASAGLISGALIPSGRAAVVEGGYRVKGRWAFASGVRNSAMHLAACVLTDDSGPLREANGAPRVRALFIPTAELEVVDTWSVIGLRGTGSHDVVIEDLFVPAERSFSLSDAPLQPGPLYAFPVRDLGAAAIGAVCLGIARGAVDALVALADAKSSVGSLTLLRDHAMVQAQVARAEALVRAGHAFLFDAVGELWETVLAEHPVTLEQRSLARLAATHACTSAALAVELMYTAGGGAAIYTSSPLERAFRDVHTATHHFSIQPATYEAAGQVLLGLQPEARFAF
jgi:alkylation response protein AidB-like acyl-CoA dehydrogenase